MSHYGEISPEALEHFRKRAVSADVDAETMHRITVIQYFFEHQKSVSETCRRFSIARSTFHRWMDRFDLSNVHSLSDRPNPAAFRAEVDLSEGVVDMIRQYRLESQYLSKDRISLLLEKEYGLSVSPSTVGRIIERECLYFGSTPFHQKNRMMKHSMQPSISTEEAVRLPLEKKNVEQNVMHREPVKTSEQEEQGRINIRFSLPLGAWKKFFVVTSMLLNITVLGSLLGAAIFESSDDRDINAINRELHASPPSSPSTPW